MGWALFVDFDGTLVELAARPDAISVPPELGTVLATLTDRFGGAVAILTGRSLRDLDRHLGDIVLPAAGLHGAERRIDPARRPLSAPAPELERLRRGAREFAAAHPGILLEDKGAALALHFRADPRLGPEVEAFARAAAAESGGALEALPGKCVWEIRPAGEDKGAAMSAFLGVPPFRGRRPLAVGDDVTDEAAFAAALAAGGAAVKVGEGETTAPWRLASPAAVRRWLGGEAP